MDNKQFPEQENDSFFPEELPEVPGDTDHEFLTVPETREEITADEHAMAWHGMTHPSEPEPPFDMSVLDDPAFDESSESTEDVIEEFAETENTFEATEDAYAEITESEESEEVYEAIERAISEEIAEETFEEQTLSEASFPDEDFRENPEADSSFEEAFNAPAEEVPIPTRERPVRKGRPRRKKGEFLFGLPQIVVTAVWLALIVVTGVTLGRMLWVSAADVLAFGREDKQVTITIYEADTIDDIANKLHNAGLIKYPGLFKIYADFAVDEGEIDPGIWDLNTRYDYHALVNMMSASSTRKVVESLLIPEGYTCRQIFELLEDNKVCTAIDIANYAASGELKEYWFLEDVIRGDTYCLEGFLFPDTYDFYENSSPKEVLEKMLDNFDHRFTEEMKQQLNLLNGNVTGNSFTLRDVIIVASMIEKETANYDESPKIASVIYNRLFNWGGNPAYLNIDASIVYALEGKTDLTTEDLQIDHPFNTYKNIGLTPGPISNPGLASIKAALNPAETNYYYYVLNPSTGVHQFSTTLDEHESWRAQFAAMEGE